MKTKDNKTPVEHQARRGRVNLQARVCGLFESRHNPRHPYTRIRLMMDLKALPDLDLQNLLDSPPLDFAHDVAGIQNNMDRSTYPGRLTGLFEPRCGFLKAGVAQ